MILTCIIYICYNVNIFGLRSIFTFYFYLNRGAVERKYYEKHEETFVFGFGGAYAGIGIRAFARVGSRKQ